MSRLEIFSKILFSLVTKNKCLQIFTLINTMIEIPKNIALNVQSDIKRKIWSCLFDASKAKSGPHCYSVRVFAFESLSSG